MPALDDALATIGANLPEDVRQAHIRDRVVALANSAQATILIEDVLHADPVQVGILVIEDLGAACVASDLPTEDAAAKLAEAGLDVVLPE